MEVMIPSFKVNPQIIGIPKDKLINIQTKIKPLHPDEEEKESNEIKIGNNIAASARKSVVRMADIGR